jgi:hypothetical protein
LIIQLFLYLFSTMVLVIKSILILVFVTTIIPVTCFRNLYFIISIAVIDSIDAVDTNFINSYCFLMF